MRIGISLHLSRFSMKSPLRLALFFVLVLFLVASCETTGGGSASGHKSEPNTVQHPHSPLFLQIVDEERVSDGSEEYSFAEVATALESVPDKSVLVIKIFANQKQTGDAFALVSLLGDEGFSEFEILQME